MGGKKKPSNLKKGKTSRWVGDFWEPPTPSSSPFQFEK